MAVSRPGFEQSDEHAGQGWVPIVGYADGLPVPASFDTDLAVSRAKETINHAAKEEQAAITYGPAGE